MKTESYYRLKYFFRIDIESVLSSLISKEKSYSPDNFNVFFPQLFHFLLENCNEYHKFLTNAYYSPSFFGEYINTSTDNDLFYIAGLRHLVFLSLMYNCIIEDWLTLRQSSCKVTKINSKAESNHRYYPLFQDQPNLAQLYSNRYKDHFLISNPCPDTDQSSKKKLKNPDFYSHKLLNDISNSYPMPSKNENYFTTPDFLAPFTYFLFNNRNVINLNKSIANGNHRLRFFGYYKEFFFDCQVHKSKLEQADSFAFTYFCEKFYHPNTVHFLLQLFNDFNQNSSSDDESRRNVLKVLDGQIFSDICVRLLQSPYIFSNNFLFNCGLNMLANTNFYPRYLTATAGFEYMHKFSNKERESFIRENGLNLLHKYLNVLSEIIGPLLNDLWSTAMDIFYPDHDAHLKAITEYLNNHRILVTSDFCNLSSMDIISIVNLQGGIYVFDDAKLKELCEKNKTTTENFDNQPKDIQRKVFDIFSKGLIPQEHTAVYDKNYINASLNSTILSHPQRINQYDHIKYIHDLTSF